MRLRVFQVRVQIVKYIIQMIMDKHGLFPTANNQIGVECQSQHLENIHSLSYLMANYIIQIIMDKHGLLSHSSSAGFHVQCLLQDNMQLHVIILSLQVKYIIQIIMDKVGLLQIQWEEVGVEYQFLLLDYMQLRVYLV